MRHPHVAWVLLFLVPASWLLAEQVPRPISKSGFLKAVEIGGLSADEMLQYIQNLGVQFVLSKEEQAELSRRGVDARIVKAIASSYRGPAVEPPRAAAEPKAAPAEPKPAAATPPDDGPPLSQEELLTLLRAGHSSAELGRIADRRGIAFAMNGEVGRAIELAGGNRDLLGTLLLKQSVVATQPAPSPMASPPAKEAHQPLTAPQGPVFVEQIVQAARLLRRIQPRYPYQARSEGIHGRVRFEAVIREDGRVHSLRAVGGHPLLIGAAEEAVRQWVYRPALENGRSVKVTTDIEVNFALSR